MDAANLVSYRDLSIYLLAQTRPMSLYVTRSDRCVQLRRIAGAANHRRVSAIGHKKGTGIKLVYWSL